MPSGDLFESQSKRSIDFENKLDFTWNQKSWVIAETTVAGFQFGKSKLTEPDRLNSVEYVQDPKLPDVIFDASSYAVLKFL